MGEKSLWRIVHLLSCRLGRRGICCQKNGWAWDEARAKIVYIKTPVPLTSSAHRVSQTGMEYALSRTLPSIAFLPPGLI
eukprot:scaffold1875_cov146-Skeletonema_dohrnii-CCMP3373.AAC.8